MMKTAYSLWIPDLLRQALFPKTIGSGRPEYHPLILRELVWEVERRTECELDILSSNDRRVAPWRHQRMNSLLCEVPQLFYWEEAMEIAGFGKSQK